jgi:drug/metabolite transporter (DMT)-like permease
MNMFKVVLLSFFTTFLVTSGQVLWKIGLQKIGGFYLAEKSILENVVRIISNGWIFSGFVVYAIATGFFMWLLSKFEISLVIPISSVAFIYSLMAGYWIFHETISPLRIVGVLFIVFGVFMVVRN